MKVLPVIVAACLAASLGRVCADTPALADVKATLDGDLYVASARLSSGLTPEILEEIDAGLEITIGYRFNVYRRRAGLPDETLLKRRLRCTVRHDALTRQYTLTRRIDGEVQDTRVTGDPQAMRDFLTVLDHVPLVHRSELTPGQDYYLRAKSDIGFIWRFYLIPWPLDTAWVRIPIGAGESATPHASP
jgi:hypothetical protein